MLLRVQMKLPSMEFVRLLKPRLGFGGADVCVDEEDTIDPTEWKSSGVENAQISLAALSERLTKESVAPPDVLEVSSASEDQPVKIAKEPEKNEPNTPFVAELDPIPESRLPEPKTRRGLLEGCRVGAIGFGRQDIGGIAGAMLEAHARVEFLPHGDVGRLTEFDLLILNCASLNVLRREESSVQSVLASGIPAIVTGSRSALSLLRGGSEPRIWDFAAKPLHMDELVWRAANLISRCQESEITRKLPARVVVADHDPFTRTLIESALTHQAFGCELAEDGESAWAAIERFQPGAVILDLTLPNRDGFQLMADIRRSASRKPKIIVLSARQSEADILRAFALGADDYITKPFSPLELSARLTRLLGGAPGNV